MPRNLTASQSRAHFWRHPLTPSSWNGVRDDVDAWHRRGTVAPVSANRELVDRIEWMHARRGKQWGPTDAELVAELDRRAFGWGEVQRQRFWSLPSWVTSDLLPPRRMGGFLRFVSVVLHAFRQGAAGVLLSYEECMSLCEVGSRSTWRRWTAELEQLGVIRIVQTWVEDTDHPSRPRRHGRLLYRVGAELEKCAGYGIVEGAAPDEKRERWARRAAMGARARARQARNERKGELWSSHALDDGAEAQESPAPSTPPALEVVPDEPTRDPIGTVTKDDEPAPAPRAEDVDERRPAPVGAVDTSADNATTATHGASMPDARKTRQPREPSQKGSQAPITPHQAVHFCNPTPPAYGSEAPAPEGPGHGEQSSQQRTPLQAATPPPGVEPATDRGLDHHREPAPAGGGAQTGVDPGGRRQKRRTRSLDELYRSVMDSPHSDPALRASLLRLKRGQ